MRLVPHVHSISVFPVKSLDGIHSDSAEINPSRCLMNDRRYAIFNCTTGRTVNGKKEPLVHLIRNSFNNDCEKILLSTDKSSRFATFDLHGEREILNEFLSDYFGYPVELREDLNGRFLDDPEVSHLTIVSLETLKVITNQFCFSSVEDCAARFRANIVIDGVPAFWEDCLFATPGTFVAFKLGDVNVNGIQPRERCVVPSRNPITGEVTRGFQRDFAGFRESQLSSGSKLSEFGHYYHLAVDCLIGESEIGKRIHVGDALVI